MQAEWDTSQSVNCPICSRQVPGTRINDHIDNGCVDASSAASSSQQSTSSGRTPKSGVKPQLASIFQPKQKPPPPHEPVTPTPAGSSCSLRGKKRTLPVEKTSSFNASKRTKLSARAPLAERMRPTRLEDFIGHEHLTSANSVFMSGVRNGSLGSVIFWGPPGCGKTTLARLYAKQTDSVFKELSATEVGIKEVKEVFEGAKNTFQLTRRRTVLFLDEIHRFSRSQQDVFLPFVEQGHIQLLGATTENPSFKLTGALLSRCRVFVLERLSDDAIEKIAKQALQRLSSEGNGDYVSDVFEIPSSATLGPSTQGSDSQSQPVESATATATSPFPSFPQVTEKILRSLASLAAGDARTALSLLELVVNANIPEAELLVSMRQSVSVSYDRTGDSHYDMISALHKSVRGGQGSAAMYWLARMLGQGEDPLFIARRMVVCASEDIGLADPQALPLAMAAFQACQVIGMPECRINLAHIVAYLSEAPKSTRSYEAYKRAEEAAKADSTAPVPMQVRNAPTKLMGDLGYGEDYHYNPNYIHPVSNVYLPPQFEGQVFLRKEEDTEGKEWDEEALKDWEARENGGRPWEGRQTSSSQPQ